MPNDLSKIISDFLAAMTFPLIGTFLVGLIVLWGRSFSKRLLSMWSAKSFFGTGPKSWVSIPTAIGSEIGQVSDIGLKWITINMVNNTRKFIPTIMFDQNTWDLLQKKAIIEAENKMKKLEDQNLRNQDR